MPSERSRLGARGEDMAVAHLQGLGYRIVERYVRPDGVEARMRNLRRQNRVIISLEPQRAVFRA